MYILTSREDAFLPLFGLGDLQAPERAMFETETLYPVNDALARLMRQERSPILYDADHPTVRLHPSIVTRLGLARALALPIRSGASLLGLILLARPASAPPFDAAEAEAGAAVARTVALGLDNARLYAEADSRQMERRSLQQITLALLQKLELEDMLAIVCQEVQRLMQAGGSVVALLEDERLVVAYTSSPAYHLGEHLPQEEPFLGQVIRRGTPVLVNAEEDGQNERGLHSLLALPLRVKGQVTGVLGLIDRPQGFLPGDVRLLQLYADQASVAVEQSRLIGKVEALAVLEERQRLARDLHDSVNQSLYSISMFSEAARRKLEQGDPPAALRHLDDVSAAAKAALGDMRRLIFELRPPVLARKGLEAALQERLRTVEERVGLETHLKVRLDGRLPERVEYELFQLVQEALNNVIKHAHAHRVMVYLVQSGRVVRLQVQDDGQGFDRGATGGGLGLKTMQERAAALKGRMEIHSQPGRGTLVVLELSL